jgi:hypothetical protein
MKKFLQKSVLFDLKFKPKQNKKSRIGYFMQDKRNTASRITRGGGGRWYEGIPPSPCRD